MTPTHRTTDKTGKIINEPDHLWSHSMDAIRYAISSLAEYIPEHIHNQQDERFERNVHRQRLNSAR